jgi:hypothetical protein
MKTSKPSWTFRTLLVLAWLSAGSAPAQVPGAPAGLSGAMLKLFGNFSAFSAKTTVDVLDASGQVVSTTPMDFALLDKKIRIEIDMMQVKAKDMPPGVQSTLKKMGMAQVVSLLRPDRQCVYLFYPEQKAMCRLPLSKEEVEAADKAAKVEKTALGKERLLGHPCVKQRVVITDSKGQKLEVTTWNASDLNDFPIQIQTGDKERTTRMSFDQVDFKRQEAGRFEPPSSFTMYRGLDELKQGVMDKLAGAGESK